MDDIFNGRTMLNERTPNMGPKSMEKALGWCLICYLYSMAEALLLLPS